MSDLIRRLIASVAGPVGSHSHRYPLAVIGLSLLLVLSATTAAMPSGTLAATTLAAKCDGVTLRTKPSTSAHLKRQLKAGDKVVGIAKVSGSHWSVRCGGHSSGSGWWRISSINGKSVKSLYGVSYLYAARGLFKTLITSVNLVTACGGVQLRTGPKTTATLKVRLSTGARVTGYGTVSGSSWTTTCSGSKVTASKWYRITAVNGKSVKSLYGVTYLYGAKGLFKSAPKTTPTPTPTPTPKPTPTPTPTPKPTPTPSPTGTPSAITAYTEGIDISHWQGTINWSQVAASGKQFAFMKASQSTDYTDPTYATNRAQAIGQRAARRRLPLRRSR